MESSTLPLGIMLLAIAAFAGFMAFRPWPVAPGTTTPIKPGAYAVEILRGTPPPASVQQDKETEIGVIEGGLATLLGVWAVSKAAKVASGASGLLGGAGSIFGKVFTKLKGVLTNPKADEAIATVAEDAAAA